jgi:DNA-binding transcriptional LysR family regulator
MNIERLSLDRLRVFSVVARTGTFSAGAVELGRAQSAVSYAISELESQLSIELFDRSAKRPKLTVAGDTVLRDAIAILERADSLLARARAISQGLENVVGLSVDPVFPTLVLVEILHDFEAAFPTVAVLLSNDALSMPVELVLKGDCAIGITCTYPHVPAGLTSFSLPPVTLVPVIAATHEMAQTLAPVDDADLRDHRQIVIIDRGPLTTGVDFGVVSSRIWRVSEMGAKLALIRNGFGWGFLPEAIARQEADAGSLVILNLVSHPDTGDAMPVNCVVRADAPLGPATQWLLDRLRAVRFY